MTGAAVSIRPLTEAQVDHLIRLFDVAAFDRESGVTAVDRRVVGFLSPMVIGKLVDFGLADKAVRQNARSQATVYWLTAKGRDFVNPEKPA